MGRKSPFCCSAPSLLLAFTGIVLTAGSAYGGHYPEDFLKLPLGTVHITESEEGDGRVGVEARCVPVKDLLEMLARRAGKPLVWDTPGPVRTYVSVCYPGRLRLPEAWIDSIPCTLGGLLFQNKDGVLRLAGPVHPHIYDPCLSEGEIVGRFRMTGTPTRPRQGITGAVLILNGRYIPGPYHVAVRPNNTGAYEVLINGLVVARHDPPSPRPAAPPPPPQLPASGQFESFKDLRQFMERVFYPKALEEQGMEKAIESTVVFLRNQQIIAGFHGDPTPPFSVEPADGSGIVTVFVVNFDFKTAKYRNMAGMLFDWNSPPRPVVPPETRAAESEASLRQNLSQPHVLMLPKFQSYGEVPDIARLRAAVCAAQGLPLYQRECIFGEFYGATYRRRARLLAVNMQQDATELCAALDELCARLTSPQ